MTDNEALAAGVALLPELRLQYEQLSTARYCAGRMEADIASQYFDRHGPRLQTIIAALEALATHPDIRPMKEET